MLQTLVVVLIVVVVWCLRRMLPTRWTGRVVNMQVLVRAHLKSNSSIKHINTN